MLWFYVSALAVLVGAELNAEIEHASPYGKDPGEKVPGEKKKIGAAGRTRLATTARRAAPSSPAFASANCDLDSGPAAERRPRRRAPRQRLGDHWPSSWLTCGLDLAVAGRRRRRTS